MQKGEEASWFKGKTRLAIGSAGQAIEGPGSEYVVLCPKCYEKLPSGAKLMYVPYTEAD